MLTSCSLLVAQPADGDGYVLMMRASAGAHLWGYQTSSMRWVSLRTHAMVWSGLCKPVCSLLSYVYVHIRALLSVLAR